MYRLRRPLQIFVFALLVMVPVVNYYGILVQQKDDYAVGRSPVYSTIHSLFRGYDRDEAVELTHRIKGSVWTMDIAGFKIADPLAVIESSVITLFLYLPLLLSVLVPVVVTVVLGKVYCGWICPMNLMLEINDKLRSLLKKTGYNTRDIRFSRKTRYAVLAVGLGAAYFAGRPLLALIYPPAVISREIFHRVYNGFWGGGVMVIVFILFFELILSRRWWCRYVCPGGAVYTLLSRFRLLTIRRNDGVCDLCGDCVPVCPYDLKPMTRDLTGECDQCGQCIAVCKPGALVYTFSPGRNGVKSSSRKTRAGERRLRVSRNRMVNKRNLVQDFFKRREPGEQSTIRDAVSQQ